MSTSLNNHVDIYHRQNTPSGLIDDLRQRAYVDKADTEAYGVKRWVNSVIKLYEQGDLAILNNDLESAYIAYMRGCSIMVEIIKLHSCYDQVRQDPVFLSLKKRTNEEIFALLQDLALRIEAWYRLSRQQNQLQQSYYNNPHFNINPTSPTTTQIASYAYIPSHDPRNFPHYSLNDLPIAAAPTTQIPQNSMNQLVQNTANLKLSENNVIQLPSWTNNQFPNMPTIEPIELAKLITSKSNPPSILLIDVRTREAFKNGCIKHQWIIQIEPVVLQHDVKTIKIQESLLQNPEAEQTLFAARFRFDLIVYYDQSSKSIETAYKPAFNMRRALESGQIKHSPKMLVGGFDAWMSAVGERGVYRFPTQKEKKHWFKSNNNNNNSGGSSSSSNSTHSYKDHDMHNSLYDYFTGKGGHHQHPQSYNNPISKPQPLPTAPRKESQTTRYPELLVPNEPFQQQQQQPPQPQPQKELRPIPPSYPKLHRRRTFIDNPFNGFTTTTSKLYDVPPMAYHSKKDKPTTASSSSSSNIQIKTRPSSAEPTVSISRPSALAEFHHVSTNNIHASSSPTSSVSFSQLNSVVTIGATGLKNLGNTCYMNSIIQCLSGTIPLARYLTSGVFRQHINKSSKSSSGGALVESFALLLRSMWSENYNFISPMTLREAIKNFAPRFANNDQHDSQEFLIFILDGLHEDLNKNSNKKAILSTIQDEADFERLPDWQASALAWERYLATNSSIIVSLFQGQYRSRLTCLTCKHTSTTYNSFMSLTLPIPAKKLRISSVTLNQCLDYFVKEEILDKEDAWRCPKCQKKRKASKQLTLSKLPDVLLIHLKRFSIDGLFRNKLDTMVKCPSRNLDLSGYVPMSMTPSPPQDRPSFIYDLYAVSNHYGSLGGGHYTASVRDGYSDKWHFFDDSKLKLIEESKVVTKAAYNLFYVRAKVK